jgi:hypothetical protein
MESPKKSSKKAVEEARADKGFNFFVLNVFIGNFQTVDEGGQGVINFCGLKDDEQMFAWSRDVSFMKI